MSVLEGIHSHQDLVQLNIEDRTALCQEIREFLISRLSQTGGHLASNLGVVELTVAIETVFDTAKDRLVFDVGHQSYVHKLLTDRQADFYALRQFGGMAGFPKPSESDTDAFVAGHASSSVSVALGMARARTVQKQDYYVVALLGDGAATGGMAFEGLNDASVSGEPMIVILNDNAMSIDRNVGGMAFHLRNLRTKPKYLGIKERYKRFLHKIPGGKFMIKTIRGFKNWIRRMLIPSTIFESMGFTYLGPVDGHDTELLIELLQNAKAMDEPVVLHVLTHKGRGFKPAEENPRKFHGIGKFDPVTGQTEASQKVTFSDTFGSTMVELGREMPQLCAITAAMPGGTGLLPFMEKYPDRLYDVGIAEEHAVSMAGGLAKQGMVPVVALYSTFLQRSYDMILQDICMLGLHAVFAIDRAGLVGEDGETHHGLFDVGFLRHAPGLKILCPASCQELSQMLRWAVKDCAGPVAIRYPRGGDRDYTDSAWNDLMGTEGGICCHREGQDVTILTYGSLVQNAMDAAELLERKGIYAKVLRLLTLEPLPVAEIAAAVSDSHKIVILEESCGCGIADSLTCQLHTLLADSQIHKIDLGHRYITHGSVSELYSHYGLDGQSVADFVTEVCSSES